MEPVRSLFRGVVAGVLGVVHALASTAQRPCGAATDFMRRAALSTTFEPERTIRGEG
jgi:hypothetical protein